MKLLLFVIYVLSSGVLSSPANNTTNIIGAAPRSFISVGNRGHLERVLRNQDDENSLQSNSSSLVTKKCVCSKIYDPVCASNNQSYYNMCQMQCQNSPNTVHVVYHGNCILFR